MVLAALTPVALLRARAISTERAARLAAPAGQ
jgi:hypothetical protein